MFTMTGQMDLVVRADRTVVPNKDLGVEATPIGVSSAAPRHLHLEFGGREALVRGISVS